jgi:hypothetical protein
MNQRSALVTLALLTACGAAERPKLATPTVDTLPGNVLSVTSPGPTAWATDSAGWRLVEDGTIGGEEGSPGELSDPQSLAVDDAGRIYVVDQSPAIIKVFAPDGQLVRTIGRDGEGPGEFRVAFIAIHGHQLVVHDPRVSRTSVFDTSGTYLRSWTSACCYYAPISIDRAARIYIPVMSGPNDHATIRIARFDTSGTVLDTIAVPELGKSASWEVRNGKQMMLTTRVPFSPNVVHGFDPAGGVLYGWSGEYRIVRSASGRDTAGLFGRSWTPVPLPAERRKAQVEKMIKSFGRNGNETVFRNAFNLADVPATLPAFSGITVDGQGNHWLRLDGDSTRTAYDVFDSTGVYLGPTVVPSAVGAYGATAWGADAFYTARESAAGTPEVVRFRLVKERK